MTDRGIDPALAERGGAEMAINWGPAAAVVAALALLSGCGGSETAAEPRAEKTSTQPSSPAPKPLEGLTAQQIFDKAKAAATAAGSVHVSGVSEGVTMDVSAAKSGDGQGTMSFEGEGKIEMLVRGGQIYVKGDKKFWTTNADKTVAQLLSGKWLKDAKKEPQFGELAEIVSLDQILAEGLKPEGTLSIVDGRDVDGQETVGLRDTSAKGDEGVLYIANAQDALPLLIVSSDGEQIAFTEWGATVTVAAPPKDLVIDIGDLHNAG